jgi:hypothetical protein
MIIELGYELAIARTLQVVQSFLQIPSLQVR